MAQCATAMNGDAQGCIARCACTLTRALWAPGCVALLATRCFASLLVDPLDLGSEDPECGHPEILWIWGTPSGMGPLAGTHLRLIL